MRQTVRAVIIISLAASTLLSEVARLGHFHRVMVSNAKLNPSRSLEFYLDSPGSHPVIRCSSLCISHLWCDLWCQSTLTAPCVISNMIVMPDYNETDMTDALTCYTRRNKDFATGASIQGTSFHNMFPLRVIDNLVDGIFARQTNDQCFFTSNDETNHWFVLDLKEPVSFRIVKIMAQPRGLSSVLHFLENIEVRVGLLAVDTVGHFSSYSYFGSFTGPATDYNQEIVITADASVWARFVSLQKLSEGPFQICHLEVY